MLVQNHCQLQIISKAELQVCRSAFSPASLREDDVVLNTD